MTSATSSSRQGRSSRNTAPASGLSLIVWGLVLCVGLLSFYVHLVHQQVERGENLRQAQLSGLGTQQARFQANKQQAVSSASPLIAGASLR